ncbi:MAG: hypothetical protein LBH43_11535 [Treponema sp.]|nr:hypothetical protein [Treponema sp.]
MYEPRKWSWIEFVLGWINKQFLVWCVATALIFISLFTSLVSCEKIQFTLVIVWGVISFCLFFYKALYILIENGKLNLELKGNLGLSKEIKENKQ